MSYFEEAQERDLILFVGSYLPQQKAMLIKLGNILDKKLIPLVLLDANMNKEHQPVTNDPEMIKLEIDSLSVTKVQNAVKPYSRRIIAATARREKSIPFFGKMVPYLPYLNTPTSVSLDWSTDKIKMRQLLRNYDKSIAPKFVIARDANQETVKDIVKKVGFPCVIKPSGLGKSLLVTICYHQDELEENLKNIVTKIHKIYKKESGRGEPGILVEEFMDGSMYSIDCYVNQRGFIYHTPLVHIKTGRDIGYDDFFGYQQITPVNLNLRKHEAARHAADKAIKALGLRSTTCHIELMKTEDGWKVIELGPRIGGFRSELYGLSYGIDHDLNDVLIRIPKKPVLPKRTKGYTVFMKFYAKKKGKLQTIKGFNNIKKLESFHRIDQIKKTGDMCNFARNGDDPVFHLIMFNKRRSDLLADIRRVEKGVDIIVKTQSNNK